MFNIASLSADGSSSGSIPCLPQSAYFQLSAASVQNNLNLAAQVTVDAYGMSALNWTINLCDVLGGLLCPLPVISFSGQSSPAVFARDASRRSS
jgi:hypothetical protein